MSLKDVDPICVIIGRTRHKMVLAEIQEAAKCGARLIEVRLDFIAKAPDFSACWPTNLARWWRRCADAKTAVVGPAPKTNGDMLLRQCIVGGFDWVDLETDIADAIPRFGKVRRIISYHNMRETPANLDKIHERMCKQDGDVVKLAVRAQKPSDGLHVLALMDKPAKPTIGIAMGDVGLFTPARRQVQRPVHLRRFQ